MCNQSLKYNKEVKILSTNEFLIYLICLIIFIKKSIILIKNSNILFKIKYILYQTKKYQDKKTIYTKVIMYKVVNIFIIKERFLDYLR